MKQYYSAGILSIIAGFIVLYYYIQKRKTDKSNRHLYMLAIAIVELITGCIGICLAMLDGVNLLLFGITMFWHMKKPHKPSRGFVNTRFKGWVCAIGGIICGILRILEDLGILEILDQL